MIYIKQILKKYIMCYSLDLNSRESKNKIFVVIFCLCAVVLTNKTIAQDTTNTHILTVLSSDADLGTVRSYNQSGSIITAMPNNTSVNFSGTATLIAIPKAGKIFVGWSDSVLNNPRMVDVSQDTTFTAIFEDCETANIDGITDRTIYANIYPHAVRDNHFIVELDASIIGSVLEMYDRWGTLVLQQVLSSQMNIIFMQNFADGVYFVGISYNGEYLVTASVTKIGGQIHLFFCKLFLST